MSQLLGMIFIIIISYLAHESKPQAGRSRPYDIGLKQRIQPIVRLPAEPVTRRSRMASKRVFALTRNFRYHLAQRTFHSYEHITPSQTSPTATNAILLSAYGHVPIHGFSHQSLNLGARDAGYLDISSSVLPDGVSSLILFHLAHQRLGLASKCEAMLKDNRKSTCNGVVGTKIADIMWARLLANKDIIHKWQEVREIE